MIRGRSTRRSARTEGFQVVSTLKIRAPVETDSINRQNELSKSAFVTGFENLRLVA